MYLSLFLMPILLAVFAAGQAWPRETYAQQCNELTNNMVIEQDTTFCSKFYYRLGDEHRFLGK